MDTISQQRIDAYRALVDLAVTAGLPMPMCIIFTISRTTLDTQLITLRLDDDNREAVARWGRALGLNPVTERPVGDFLAVEAEAWNDDGPIWLGFRQVEVWSRLRQSGVTRG